MTALYALVLLVLSLVPTYAAAADSRCVESASADVWLVRSGGLWKAAEGIGNYRVVVTKRGVEHSQDEVQVQITRIVDSSREIVRCIDLSAPGLQGYVRDIGITSISESAAAIEISIEMKGMEGTVLQAVFLVSQGGKVRQIQRAEYADLSGFGDNPGSEKDGSP